MTSVAPLSPQLCRAKRGRRSPEFEVYSPIGKRQRHQAAEADALDTSVLYRSAKHRLHTLFPDMDEKVITRVLETCHGSLEEALEKLTELSLTTNSSPTCDQESIQAGKQFPQASSSQRKQEAGPKPSKLPVPSSVSGPEEVERWASALCDEATAATDKQDLQRRIFNFLSLCKQHIEEKQAEALGTHVSDLQQQNAVLKKAVAIQHTRMTKHSAEKEAQLRELQGLLQASETRVAALEASNYALTLHLRQATDSRPGIRHPHPDVF